MAITFILLLICGCLLCFSRKSQTSKFIEKWPAITDDEFLERCPEGTSTETALKVRRIISAQLGIPYDHIYPEQEFVKDLGIE